MKKVLALILALSLLAATAVVGFSDPDDTLDPGTPDPGIPALDPDPQDPAPEAAPYRLVIEDNDGAFTTGSASVGSSQEFQLKVLDDQGAPTDVTSFQMRITGADITLEEYTIDDENGETKLGWFPAPIDGVIYYLSSGTNDYRITFNSAGTVEYWIQRDYVALSVSGSEPLTGQIVVGGAGGSNDNPSVTDNEANSGETHEAIRNGQGVGVDLHIPAAISLYTMNLLGAHPGSSLTVEVGGYSLYIPGGFGQVNEPGRCYYPVDYHSPSLREKYYPAVPEGVEFETADLAGAMPMPTTVTVTAETDLEGTVYVYLWDEDTDKVTYIAAPTAEDGEITFTTTVLGRFLFTGQEL